MHPTKTKIVYWAGGRVAMIIDPKSRTARHSYDQEKIQ
jgi:hypothetical protein